MDEARSFKGEDEAEEVDGEGKDPEQRDGGHVAGEVAGDGAELHGGGKWEEEPKEFGAEGSERGRASGRRRVRKERWAGLAGLPGQGRGQKSEEDDTQRPEMALSEQWEMTFDDGRIEQEGEQGRDVRESEQMVGDGTTLDADEPHLEERAGGGEQEKRETDGTGEIGEDAEDGRTGGCRRKNCWMADEGQAGSGD